MSVLLLIVIYISFISLGLPDSMLGSAWPAMRAELGLPLDAAGLITIIVTAGTVVSSLLSNRLTSRFGSGRVTAFSVLATCAALFGFALSPSLGWLILFSIPLGIGGGAVDAALNNYVALHYAARHMSWLHCFWGLGAFVGPTILSFWLRQTGSWRSGFTTVGIIQAAVTLLLFIVLPFWMKHDKAHSSALATSNDNGWAASEDAAPAENALRIPGVPFALLTFVLYCALEYCASLWSSSFFVEARGMSEAAAAQGTSLFFVGITMGRLLTGFLTIKLSSKVLIRLGALLILSGGLIMLLPAGGLTPIAGLLLVGFGCAPVYPCMIHETPKRFGAQNSAKIIGWQMASAYTGSLAVPPLFGLLAGRVGTHILPAAFLVIGVLLLCCTEVLNRLVARARPA